jgi:SIT4-associating protein SAP185/190
MFWRFGGYANVSSIDTILDKPDVTVEELLDEDDLIQELKSQNSKLIEFLRDDNVLQRLLQYVIAPSKPTKVQPVESSEEQTEKDREEDKDKDKDATATSPLNNLFGKRRSGSKADRPEGEAESSEEKTRLDYAYLSCEILSSDVWSIVEAVLENRPALKTFWEFLHQEELDPAQASYFAKVNESLLDKKTDELLDVFKSIDGVVPDMLRHINVPVIMDLLLKIISMERSEGGQGILDWLQAHDLIPLLLAHLSEAEDNSTQINAGEFLKAIISMSANATAQDTNVIGPNELTRQLVSEDCVQMLIKDMLRGGNALTVGVGIVIEVIRKNNSDYDVEVQTGPTPRSTDPIYLGILLRQFAQNIPNFMTLIENAGKKAKEIKVASGGRIEPLGFDRFKTCELFAELLHCSNMMLLNEPGSESEIKTKDKERARLRAEGKLTPRADNSALEFGTSVDSSGFHHARAPSMGESPEEIKRLEVSNSGEEEFENVTGLEDVEEMKDEFEMKEADVDEPEAGKSPIAAEKSPTEQKEESIVEKLSPTSAGVTDKLGSVGIDDDTVMEDAEPKPEVRPLPPPKGLSDRPSRVHSLANHPSNQKGFPHILKTSPLLYSSASPNQRIRQPATRRPSQRKIRRPAMPKSLASKTLHQRNNPKTTTLHMSWMLTVLPWSVTFSKSCSSSIALYRLFS